MKSLSTVESDKRPFKGKGVEGAVDWLRQSQREYKKILDEMALLSDESKRVGGSVWYVFRHHRNDSGQHFLMWRSVGVNSMQHVHLTWNKVEPHLHQLSQERAAWYREANSLMILLNAKEKIFRLAVKQAKGVVLANGVDALDNE